MVGMGCPRTNQKVILILIIFNISGGILFGRSDECADESSSGYWDQGGGALTCTWLATHGYCLHEEHGADISETCQKSCASCLGMCLDSVYTGFGDESGQPLSCEYLGSNGFCTHGTHGSLVTKRCCTSCTTTTSSVSATATSLTTTTTSTITASSTTTTVSATSTTTTYVCQDESSSGYWDQNSNALTCNWLATNGYCLHDDYGEAVAEV